MLRTASTLSQVVSWLVTVCLAQGCFSYQRTAESKLALGDIKEAKSSPQEFCRRVLNAAAPSPEIFFWAAECSASNEQKCGYYQQAHHCGHPRAEGQIALLHGCIPKARPPLRNLGSSGTILFPYGQERMSKCGYKEDLTTIGYILAPVGIVIAVPVVLVFGTIGCLVPVQGCPLADIMSGWKRD